MWACLVDPAIFPDGGQRRHLFELLRHCEAEGLLGAADTAALLRDNFLALDPGLLDAHAYQCLEQFVEQARGANIGLGWPAPPAAPRAPRGGSPSGRLHRRPVGLPLSSSAAD